MSKILYSAFGKIGKDFENRFIDEETELLFLTLESSGGGTVCGNDVIKPSLNFVAAVDLSTGELYNEKGRLEWLFMKSADQKGWGFDFKKYNIYHIKARKNIPVKLEENMLKTLNNCYMITEVIDDGKSDPRLEELKESYSKPVYIDDPKLGRFTLNRQFSNFEGSVNWLGKNCTVFIELDEEDSDTANKAFSHLKDICSDAENWDIKFRKYAAEELIDLANDWLYEVDEEINEEELFEELYISALAVCPDGKLTLYYHEDKEIFGDHAVQISANINSEFFDVEIVG